MVHSLKFDGSIYTRVLPPLWTYFPPPSDAHRTRSMDCYGTQSVMKFLVNILVHLPNVSPCFQIFLFFTMCNSSDSYYGTLTTSLVSSFEY